MRRGVLEVSLQLEVAIVRDSRTRERTMANNLSWLRRFAITLVKRHPTDDSLRGKLLGCAYNTDFLTEVLTLNKV